MLKQDDAITNLSPVVIKSCNDRTVGFIVMQLFCFVFSKGIERDYKITLKQPTKKSNPCNYIIFNIQYNNVCESQQSSVKSERYSNEKD